MWTQQDSLPLHPIYIYQNFIKSFELCPLLGETTPQILRLHLGNTTPHVLWLHLGDMTPEILWLSGCLIHPWNASVSRHCCHKSTKVTAFYRAKCIPSEILKWSFLTRSVLGCFLLVCGMCKLAKTLITEIWQPVFALRWTFHYLHPTYISAFFF